MATKKRKRTGRDDDFEPIDDYLKEAALKYFRGVSYVPDPESFQKYLFREVMAIRNYRDSPGDADEAERAKKEQAELLERFDRDCRFIRVTLERVFNEAVDDTRIELLLESSQRARQWAYFLGIPGTALRMSFDEFQADVDARKRAREKAQEKPPEVRFMMFSRKPYKPEDN